MSAIHVCGVPSIIRKISSGLSCKYEFQQAECRPLQVFARLSQSSVAGRLFLAGTLICLLFLTKVLYYSTL